MILHGYLKITDFNLIIFDECHNGRGEHPMTRIMAKFSEIPDEQQPRVIGLTGSLTSSSIKPNNVLDDLKTLEATFRATITTVQGLTAYKDVMMYSTNPNESVISYETTIPTKFIEFLISRIDVALRNVASWPIVEPSRSADNSLIREPKIQNRLKKICNNFVYQISNSGMYDHRS